MNKIHCKFCFKETPVRYGGYCQVCWRYFVYDGFKQYDLPNFGEIGYVTDENDRQYGMVICHICGKAFVKLQNHIYHSHNILKKDYCRQFGIDNKSRLTSDEYHIKMRDYAYKYNMDEQVVNVGKDTRFKTGHSNYYVRSPMTINRLRGQFKHVKNKKECCEVEEMNNSIWYFTDDDYDTFSFENEKSTDKQIRDAREIVRQKLLELNKPLLKRFLKAGIKVYNHPASIRNPKLITSLTVPCEYNKGKVSWLGVRYGKSEQHLNLLNYGIQPKWKSSRDDEIDKLGFQKYACLQVDVDYSGVDVGIYHAVPHDALDRAYLHDNIDKKADNIINELKKIRFKGYYWSVYDPDSDTEELFYFDRRPVEDFIKWYKKTDRDGTYSFMLKNFPRYDYQITKDRIEDTCFNVISELYGLYQVLSWQPNKVKGVND